MTAAKNPAKASAARNTTVRGNKAAKKPAPKRPSAAKPDGDADGNGRVRGDQFGAILAKGLDLA